MELVPDKILAEYPDARIPEHTHNRQPISTAYKPNIGTCPKKRKKWKQLNLINVTELP